MGVNKKKLHFLNYGINATRATRRIHTIKERHGINTTHTIKELHIFFIRFTFSIARDFILSNEQLGILLGDKHFNYVTIVNYFKAIFTFKHLS
jgi:hypothetical protein